MDFRNDPAGGDQDEQIGAGLEAAGLMSQSNYVRLVRLSRDIEHGDGSIADADLEWALAVL
jgi:hypothetical protein